MRERILDTATALFVEHGYAGVSMRELAAACGITKAALYYHYASKAELLAEIVNGYLEQVAAAMAEATGGGGGAEAQLRRVVHRLFELPDHRRAILRLAMHDLCHLAEDQRADFGRAYAAGFTGPLRALIAAGAATGELVAKDPELVVWLLLGMLYPFFAPTGAGRAPSDPAAVDDLLDIFFRGLRSRP